MDETKYHRQLDILDPKLMSVPVVVIGAGATGSFAALSLAKMGVRNITVYDLDTVEEHNLPNQFYRQCDIGKPKVIALQEIIEQFEGIQITVKNEKYRGQRLDGVVITCVDSMDARLNIWKFVMNNSDVQLYIDSRMGAEVMRVYTVNPMDIYQCRAYEENLYPSSEALQERCTAKTIMYTVFPSLPCSQIR